jgi:AcrR family transcriptional regulator
MSQKTARVHTKPLTRDKIAAAAIEIVREEGHEALSMRKVAARFDVDVAALYRHVRNKDGLLEVVGRLASDRVELEAPTEGSLEERFIELGGLIRERIVAHPELGIYHGDSPRTTPFYARANALIAALLVEAGLAGNELVFATQTVLHMVTSVAESEVLARATSPDQNRAFARTISEHLPDDVRAAWPATSREHDWTIDFDLFFEFVLRSALIAVVPGSRDS